MESKKIIPLLYPITLTGGPRAGEELAEVCLGRFKVKHLNLLPKNMLEGDKNLDSTEIIPLLAGLLNLPVEDVEEIDVDDLKLIVEELKNIFPQ